MFLNNQCFERQLFLIYPSRWRLIVHGGIDGFSRLITFLSCSNNNKSTTIFRHFQDAVHQFGLPMRVRSDCGGESVKVSNC